MRSNLDNKTELSDVISDISDLISFINNNTKPNKSTNELSNYFKDAEFSSPSKIEQAFKYALKNTNILQRMDEEKKQDTILTLQLMEFTTSSITFVDENEYGDITYDPTITGCTKKQVKNLPKQRDDLVEQMRQPSKHLTATAVQTNAEPITDTPEQDSHNQSNEQPNHSISVFAL